MQTSSPPWVFGPFQFNPAAFRLYRDGTVVALEPKALDVLRLLLERAPDVVEKSEIFAIVWRDVAVTDNALTRVVAQIRKALDDDAKNPRYVETVATRGYRIVADVRLASQTDVVTPAVAAISDPESQPASSHGGLARRSPAQLVLWAAFMVFATLAVLAVVRPMWHRAVSGEDVPLAPVAVSPNDAPDIARMARLRPVQLTTGSGHDGNPAFSFDGTSLAYASDRSGAFEIYVQGLVPGSAPTPLTSNRGQNTQPAWSPDGQFMAFHEAAGGGIWIVPSRGGTARRVAESGSHPAWSPDGGWIAFQTLQSDITMLTFPTAPSAIQIVDPRSGSTRPVTRLGIPPGPHVSPQWSGDGRRIYFVEAPLPYTGGRESAQTAIWSVGVDGTDLRKEASGDLITPEYAPARDGHGAWIVTRTASIWWQPFAPGTGGGVARPTGMAMPGMAAQPALSRDGRHLAWTARSAKSSLWTVAMPDSRGHPAAAAPMSIGSGVRATGAAADPEGRLAYSGAVQGNPAQIWMRDDDGGMRQVTADEGDHLIPMWLTGHREVAFFGVHRGIITYNAVDVTTGRERELFGLADLAPPAGFVLHPMPTLNVAPDEQFGHVVVSLVKDGIPNLWVSALTGGKPDGMMTQLTFEQDGGSFPHWSPDGRWVSYQCGEGANTNACVVAADGTSRRQLTNEPGQSFIGGWMGNDSILVAARRRAVWNVISVGRTSGTERPITAFSDARSYVRYPQWDGVGRRVIFERAETIGNVWTVELP